MTKKIPKDTKFRTADEVREVSKANFEKSRGYARIMGEINFVSELGHYGVFVGKVGASVIVHFEAMGYTFRSVDGGMIIEWEIDKL